MTVVAQPARRPLPNSDVPRELLTVASYVLTLAVNAAANLLPINGQGTAEISDRFQVYVVPAGYVFGIWGVIYLGLGAYTIYQVVRGDDPVVRELGWLPAISGLLNSAWILCFHYELFPLSVVVMLALLFTLLLIDGRIRRAGRLDRASFWAVRIPFSIYLGWISVAALANIAQTLAALGFEPTLITWEWLASIVLVGLAATTGRFVMRHSDPALGLVVVWALAGVAVKEASTPIVPWVAAASAVGMALVVGMKLLRRATAA